MGLVVRIKQDSKLGTNEESVALERGFIELGHHIAKVHERDLPSLGARQRTPNNFKVLRTGGNFDEC